MKEVAPRKHVASGSRSLKYNWKHPPPEQVRVGEALLGAHGDSQMEAEVLQPLLQPLCFAGGRGSGHLLWALLHSAW